MTINTGGGFYNSGEIHAQTVVGRDQYNYYFVGLAPLVHDPTRRFRNFLNEYLGTPDQPVPFGGRQAQLDELHGWLNDVDAPPYYLMSAEAGRGKSALVCRWMEEVRRQRPAVEVIFIPISIRFETAAQDVVFAALAARLAQIYDEPLKPAALSGAQWQGVCESYLDRTPPHGKQLLIILDGLDEATGWRFGAGFFSTNPPPGLRIVVTARLRVGESTPQGWAATLGWQERLTRMATLPPLTRAGVEEALASMGDPLAEFADQATIIEQLYRLTEGDPLLVRLYVQEFEQQKATLGTLTSAALQQMTPGLQGYFDQWWKGQKEQWRAQGSDPKKEEAHLRLLLDALSAAFGPLTLDDLAQLHPGLGSSRLIRALLQSVERWVIGDGKVQGYSYSHSRLGYYFWEQLSDKEQREWDGRFCAWGARTLAALNGGELDPKAAPVYLLRHYAEHLERSHAPAERFYALISNGWRRAWEDLDISYGGFLNDVEQARVRASTAYTINQLGCGSILVQQVRAALCRTSVAAMNDNMSTELFTQILAANLLKPAQALAILKLVSDEKKRIEMLKKVLVYLPNDLMGEALSIASLISNEYYRHKALAVLIPQLPVILLGEILRIIKMFADEESRTNLLVSLMTYLPEGAQRERLDELLTASLKIIYKELRVDTLVALIPYLPPGNRRRAIGEALNATLQIDDVGSQITALATLTPYLSTSNRRKVLDKLLTTIRHIRFEEHRIEKIVLIVPYLSKHKRNRLLTEALNLVIMIKDEMNRANAMAKLASHLSVGLLKKAFATAQAIKNEHARVRASVTVALYLSKYGLEHLLWEVLDNARSSVNKEFYIDELISLAPNVSKNDQGKILEEALSITRTTKIDSGRTQRLLALATHLPEGERAKLVEGIMYNARVINDKLSRTFVFDALVPYFPKGKRTNSLKSALARSIADEHYRATGIILLAPHLPPELLQMALNTIHAIGNENARTNTLNALVPHLPHNLLGEALTIARMIRDEDLRSQALCALAPHVPANLVEELLSAARLLKEEHFRANTLGSLIPYLSKSERPKVLLEALQVAYTITDKHSRVLALATLAIHLSASERVKILEDALIVNRAIIDKFYRSSALISIAQRLSGSERAKLIEEAFAITRTIESNSSRAAILIAIAPYLPTDLLKEVLDFAHSIEYNETRYTHILVAIAPLALEHEKDKTLGEALVSACLCRFDIDLSLEREIQHTYNFSTHPLRRLTPHLVIWVTEQPQQSYLAFTDALIVLAERPRSEFLSKLANMVPFILALAGDEAPQAAEGIYHAIQEVCEWWP